MGNFRTRIVSVFLSASLVVALATSPSLAYAGAPLGVPATVPTAPTPASISAAANGTNNQNNAQQNTANASQQGAGLAKVIGLVTIAMGGLTIAKGVTEISTAVEPTAAAQRIQGGIDMAMGALILLSGVQAMQGSKAMSNNANQATGSSGDLNSGITKLGDTNSPGSGVSLDTSDFKNGKVGAVMDQFAKASGISTDQLARDIANGKSAMDILNQAKGKLGLSDAQLKKAMSDASAMMAADPSAGSKAAAKLGIDGIVGSAAGTGGYAEGGAKSGGSASGKASSLDDFLSGLKKDEPSGIDSLQSNFANLSPEVRANLEKNGLGDKSLFQMISSQYQKNLPTIFGLTQKDDNGVRLPDNPNIDHSRILSSLKGQGI